MAADPQAMKDVDDIRAHLPGYGSWQEEGTYDDVLLVVHPGYFRTREWFKVDSDRYEVTGEDYLDYEQSLFEEVENWVENSDPVVVLYPGELEEETRDFFDLFADDVDWIPTEDRSAVLTDHGKEDFSAVYASLESPSRIKIAGESEQKCYRYQKILLETLDRELWKELEIVDGPSFDPGD